MVSANSADDAVLEPLFACLGRARPARLVVQPHRVTLERVEGCELVAVPWDADQHARALAVLATPYCAPDGTMATALGSVIVLVRAPASQIRLEDLVREGRLSGLAARFLSGALTLGRNLVVAAPWAVGAELVGAALAECARAGVVASPTCPVPTGSWLGVRDSAEARALGLERVGAWGLDEAEALPWLRGVSGCMLHVESRRIDRLLVRLELTADEHAANAGQGPLAILAGLDVVVVASQAGGVRVREIAEIAMSEAGYQPRLLFASNLPPVPTALVPVAVPQFVDELHQAGFSVLADELRHAAHSVERGPAVPSPSPREERGEAARPVVPMPRTRPVLVPTRVEPAGFVPPRLDPSLADAAPPGWELDRLPAEDIVGSDTGPRTAEAATLAATFGLAPPPPPPGVMPMSAETLTSMSGEGSSFAEALKRARVRDEADLVPPDDETSR